MGRFSNFFRGHRNNDASHNKKPKAQDKGKGKAPAQPTAPAEPTTPSHPPTVAEPPRAPPQPAPHPATAALLSHFDEAHAAVQEQRTRLAVLQRQRADASARRRAIVKTLRAPPYRPPPRAYREAYLDLVGEVRALYRAAEAAECALAQKLPTVIVQLEAYLDATHGVWNPERYSVDRWGAMRAMFVWEMGEGGLGPAAVPRLAAETHSCGPEYEVLALSRLVDYDVVRDTTGKVALS